MTWASVSVDRRAAYYERAADLIAADGLAFYTRAERGRQVQARIQKRDLTLERLRSLPIGKPSPAPTGRVLRFRRGG